MEIPKTLYHVSFDKQLSGTVRPKVPDGFDGGESYIYIGT